MLKNFLGNENRVHCADKDLSFLELQITLFKHFPSVGVSEVEKLSYQLQWNESEPDSNYNCAGAQQTQQQKTWNSLISSHPVNDFTSSDFSNLSVLTTKNLMTVKKQSPLNSFSHNKRWRKVFPRTIRMGKKEKRGFISENFFASSSSCSAAFAIFPPYTPHYIAALHPIECISRKKKLQHWWGEHTEEWQKFELSWGSRNEFCY